MRRCLLSFFFFALPLLPAATDWKLLWSDEFNGTANTPPDPAKWTYDVGAGGWGNNELETYTNGVQNVFQDGEGHLAIRAVRMKVGDVDVITSARIKTEGKFSTTYGRIAVRMKIPSGQGIWPAFWMLGNDIETNPWPKCGEIDVVENIGREPAIVHGTIHGPGYSGAHGIGSPYAAPRNRPLSADFHVYSVEWSPGSIQFFLDDHSYFSVTTAALPKKAVWVYNHPFFLLLNLAIGGDWPGNPDSTTEFPQTLLVDWVRVWQPVRLNSTQR